MVKRWHCKSEGETRFIVGVAIAVAICVGHSSLAKETPKAKPTLEEVLLPAIKQHRGDVAVAVKHLKTGQSYEYKADEAMPTASLIKFPIMIATYEEMNRRISVLEGIALGEKAIREGREVSQKEAKRRLAKWLK